MYLPDMVMIKSHAILDKVHYWRHKRLLEMSDKVYVHSLLYMIRIYHSWTLCRISKHEFVPDPEIAHFAKTKRREKTGEIMSAKFIMTCVGQGKQKKDRRNDSVRRISIFQFYFNLILVTRSGQ